METDLPPPQARANQVGRSDLERRLRTTMSEGALSHGWIISGAPGAGKATLAYRLARGRLDPEALSNDASFEMPDDARCFRLVAAGAHPDLFVAQREWDEKTSRYKTEITVETIRKLTKFLNRTASGGGWRVAIIDSADDMNRNAANALLKALEEPPAKVLLLLVSSAPGRLLATIRSRCRKLELAALPETEIETLLIAEGLAHDDAEAIAAISRGRPGYALRLAAEGGDEAVRLAHGFLKAVVANADISKFFTALGGKAGDPHWAIFKEAVIDILSDAARETARGNPHDFFPNAQASQLLAAWEQASKLIAQGEGLNLDRAQLIRAIGYDLRAILQDRAA